MKVFLAIQKLGGEEIPGTFFMVREDDEAGMAWLEYGKAHARAHSHPDYELEVQTLEFVGTETIKPSNPRLREEMIG